MDGVKQVLEFFSENIEKTEEEIAVMERKFADCEKEIKRCRANKWILLFIGNLFRERKLNASINRTGKTLNFLEKKFKEMSFAKKRITDGDYEPAILLLEEIIKEYPEDFISKFLLYYSYCDPWRVTETRNFLIFLAKQKGTHPLIG